MEPQTLADFLLARIAEDEVRVTTIPDWYCTDSARGEGWGSRGDCRLCGHYMFDGTEDVTEQAYYEHLEDTHRRARVLAECEAKRRIVAEHRNLWGTEPHVCSTCVDSRDDCIAFPCPTLRALASVHADHPDYREEWA